MKVTRSFFGYLVIFVVVLAGLFGLPLFLAAGSLQFWNGWLFLGIFVLCSVVISLVNPELAQKRAKGTEKEKSQGIIKLGLTLCTFSILVIAGLDHRFGWSWVPLPIVIVSAAVMAGAFGILSMVVKQNWYATRVVEIQEEQQIIDTGIYALVRHPMYMAFTLLFMVSPLVLGSLYALLPALCFPFLLAFRIRKEEEVLRMGLAGYDLYRKKVKYRLIPFVW